MFNCPDLTQKYEQYLQVKKTAKKVGKIFAIIGSLPILFVGCGVIGSSGDITVGTVMAVLAMVCLEPVIYYQMGKCGGWAYHWLLERTNDSSTAIIATLFVGFYLGLFLRIKYRGFDKKIKKLYHKNQY